MAVLFLVLVVLINVAVNFAAPSPPQCWEFDSAFSGWYNDGFTSSIYPPNTTGIPNWAPPTDYAYLQTTSSNQGRLSLNSTINDGDVISARLYQHVVDYGGTDRISFSLICGDISNILVNPNYNAWEGVETKCGNGYICCSFYPCRCKLQIDGSVLTPDELVGVDYVAINSGCGSGPPPTSPPPSPPPPPPPTTTTPSPSIYDCNFDTSVCGWSLATESTGWHWSYDDGPPINSNHPYFPAPPSGNYIWVEDESAQVSSQEISNVSSANTIYFDYFFDTETTGGPDYFDVWFHIATTSDRVFLGQGDYSRMGWVYNQEFASPVICRNADTCSGQVVINTHNVPYNGLLLAIDNFTFASV